MNDHHLNNSLLRDKFTRQCNSATTTPNFATGDATSSQQPPRKSASLLELARNKLRNNHATSVQYRVQQAHETAIRNWMTFIGEFDEALITEILNNCYADSEALAYFLKRSKEVSQ